MARILIAGCGDVGGALGVALAAAGHEVFGLRRRSGRLPPSLRPVSADLTRPETLARLPRDLDLAVYAAAADGYDEGAYEAAYVRGPGHLVAALRAGSPRLQRLLFVSSTGVYGQRGAEVVDEDSPTQPRGFSGRRLLQGEALVRGAGLAATVVRFGGIYGPGRTRLIERVRGGAACSEAPPRWTNRIHRDDCAGVLRHLLFLGDPHPLYLGVDCEPAPECVVMDWLAVRLGVALPPRAAADADVPRNQGKRCSNARLLASGYAFRHATFREGYAAVLGAMAREPGGGS